MASSKKEGGKNRKIGRHSRNPSSCNQAKRTERNKAKRAQKVVRTPPKHNNPATTSTGRHVWVETVFRGKRERVYCM